MTEHPTASRRAFLAGGLAIGGGALAAGARAATAAGDPAILRAAELDDDAGRRRRRATLRAALGLRGRRYSPQRALADRRRGQLGQLHAALRARRHHHPERPLLRAPSRRRRPRRPGRMAADDPRHGRHAAGLHAGRPQALPARKPRLLPGMRRELRHGVARRAAERLPVHARHDPQRHVHGRAAEADPAGGGHARRREVAAGRGRRRRRDDALDPDGKGARRLHRRLQDERRDAAPRAGLSGPPGRARLGRQHVDQVAAPARGRRQALAHSARRHRSTPT